MKKKLIVIAFTLSLSLNLLVGIFYGKKIYGKFKAITKQTVLADFKDETDNLNLDFYNGQDFLIWGKLHKERNFNRLPDKYQNIVRPAVWNLSKCSSGIQIKFETNSPTIWVKWKLSKNANLLNMSKIGVSGVDLYCKSNNEWQYVNSGIPSDLMNTKELISRMDTIHKEFILNLPLYDGVESLEIGIKKGFKINKGKSANQPTDKPIIFYGTSITQGGSASRPGMAYPSIISRHINVETINLGFSGNGRFEQIIGQAICETASKLIVIDCTPNSHPDTIKTNTLPLLQQIRKCHSETPILLVESIIREYSYFKSSDTLVFGTLEFIESQNAELRNAFNKAEEIGIAKIYYLESDGLIGYDHEATVDGTHLSDLGQYRIAEKIESKIREILKIKETTGANNVYKSLGNK